MRTLTLLTMALWMLCAPLTSVAKDRRSIVRLETSMGVIRIALYDDTPIHRDNFLRLVSEGFYDGLLFHRVIKDFMIQTGDPNSKNAPRDSVLGDGDVNYVVPPEICLPYIFHRRGAVAAARLPDDVNPDQYSSGCESREAQLVVAVLYRLGQALCSGASVQDAGLIGRKRRGDDA